MPSHFEASAEMVSEDTIAGRIVCGPDPAKHLEAIQTFVDAEFDHVYVHQIGQDQEAFFDFYEREVLAEAEYLRVPSAEEARTVSD